MIKPNKIKVVASNSSDVLNKDGVIALVDGIYVGYHISHTLENAVTQASRRMMDQLKVQVPHEEVMKMMNGMDVVSAGGLHNYLYKIYLKIAAYEDTKKSA